MSTVAIVLLSLNLNTATPNFEAVTTEDQITRVYKFKNTRIKKALSFTTKRNNSKLA